MLILGRWPGLEILTSLQGAPFKLRLGWAVQSSQTSA